MPPPRTILPYLFLPPFLWLAMQWLHETGHILACLAAGGSLDHVVLAPWSFSRTDTASDPHPLLTTWAGPLLGALFPLLAHLAFPRSTLLRLLAAFCLLANGSYLFFGALSPVADAATLLHRGAPLCSLLLVGFTAMASSLLLSLRIQNRALIWRPAKLARAELTATGILVCLMIAFGSAFFRDRL